MKRYILLPALFLLTAAPLEAAHELTRAEVVDEFVRVAGSGELWRVKGILEAHPEIINELGSNDFTALMAAARNGYKDIVRLLLAKGADPNIKDSDGYTALMVAEIMNHGKVIQMLKVAIEERKGAAAPTQPLGATGEDKPVVTTLTLDTPGTTGGGCNNYSRWPMRAKLFIGALIVFIALVGVPSFEGNNQDPEPQEEDYTAP